MSNAYCLHRLLFPVRLLFPLFVAVRFLPFSDKRVWRVSAQDVSRCLRMLPLCSYCMNQDIVRQEFFLQDIVIPVYTEEIMLTFLRDIG